MYVNMKKIVKDNDYCRYGFSIFDNVDIDEVLGDSKKYLYKKEYKFEEKIVDDRWDLQNWSVDDFVDLIGIKTPQEIEDEQYNSQWRDI